MRSLCILIPVYNNRAGLVQTCASLAQAEGSFDILVVDDGSDLPISLPPHAAGRHRLDIHRLSANRGITGALNAGLALINERGYHFTGRLDSSDTVDPTRFERQLAYLNANPKCGIVGSYVQFAALDGKPLFLYRSPASHLAIHRKMRSENCLIHSAVTLRTSVVTQVGGYRERCQTSEDYELFLRVIRVSEAAVLPFPLTRCEYNLAGISVSRRRNQQRERLRLQMQYFSWGNWASYYGVARTCLALTVPHLPVLLLKRALFVPSAKELSA